MAVVLANALLMSHARAHPVGRDARGKPVVAADAEVTTRGPAPGAVAEPDVEKGPEGGGYRLRVDPTLGPLAEGDWLTDERGRTFRVRTAKLIAVPGCSAVDFIRVSADLDPPERV